MFQDSYTREVTQSVYQNLCAACTHMCVTIIYIKFYIIDYFCLFMMQTENDNYIVSVNYESESFQNLVYFYYNELMAIKNGVNSDEIFSKREKTTLKIKGLIGYNNSSETWLTQRTLKIMKELENNIGR